MGNPEHTSVDATSKSEGSESQVDYEKRFKDTQGAFKSQQELVVTKAKLEALEKLTTPKVELDEAAKTELEDLKFSNPDAWRTKMNKLEKEAQTQHNATLSEAGRIAANQAELDDRTQVFADFQANNPDLTISDDTIKYDIPPRLTNKLETGTIDFGQYLEEVKTYLTSGKIIGDGNKTLNQPNLANVGGDNNPTKSAVDKDIVKNYQDMVY